MTEPQNQNLSNLKIMGDSIVFSPESKEAELLLSNLHQTYYLYFKVQSISNSRYSESYQGKDQD